MPRSKIGKDFDEVVRWFRKEFPTKRGFRVTTVQSLLNKDGFPLDGLMKDSGIGPYRIIINRNASDPISVLLHEGAHVLDYEKFSPSKNCHSASWGVEYSKIYRRWDRWIAEKDEEQ